MSKRNFDNSLTIDPVKVCGNPYIDRIVSRLIGVRAMSRRRLTDNEESLQLLLNFDAISEESAHSLPHLSVPPTQQQQAPQPRSSTPGLSQQTINSSIFRKAKKLTRSHYSPEYLKTIQNWYRQSWGEIFYNALSLEWTFHHLDPVLGWLKGRRARGSYWSAEQPLTIHRLEKDLAYLNVITINKRAQLFLSFPASPVALGILTIAYYANLPREERDLLSRNHAIASKSFVLWIRPHDNGQIQNLKFSRSSNSQVKLNEQLVCLPAYRFEEAAKETRLQVVMARSLSEGVELLQRSKYCSLVILDDPSGRTCLSSSKYGNEVFELAKNCKERGIPMIGIVPPWAMQQIEYCENSSQAGILLWAIDSGALQSYPVLSNSFAKNEILHPIEESYQMLTKRQELGIEPQITIKTISFDSNDEGRIAEAFQEVLNLLVALSKQPELKNVWIKGWEIWRDLTAPVLPFHLLWEQFLQNSLKKLEAAAQRCNDSRGLMLFTTLNSLIERFQKLTQNPFLRVIESLEGNMTIAVTDVAHADALRNFLAERSPTSIPKVLAINELQGQGGEKLVIIGQPKARHRDLIQTTFFRQVDVLLWATLADRAESWWSGLEIDSRAWHAKTWRSLTGQEFGGRYEYSNCPKQVKVVHSSKTKLYKSIDISKLEEKFGELSETSLDSALTGSAPLQLSAHYLVELDNYLNIRVSLDSEFLVLARGQVRVVSVQDIRMGTTVVLFEGMNRDELFDQKAGLLEETRDNWLYRVQLEGWRTLVKQRTEQLDIWTISQQVSRSTGIDIGEGAIRCWMNGDDLLSLPQEKDHFFWFLPPAARPGFEDFWCKAHSLREKRRQLGRVISACAQEGWKERNADEIVFQYQQVFITVGELREAMQVLKVRSTPQLVEQKPDYPFNRLFRRGE
jgi:hypothetical protein